MSESTVKCIGLQYVTRNMSESTVLSIGSGMGGVGTGLNVRVGLQYVTRNMSESTGLSIGSGMGGVGTGLNVLGCNM
jgi:hypothetical protein